MGGENDPDAPEPAAVLEAVKARPGDVGVCCYGGATAGRDSFCARRRRKSAVGAEESLRRGRTKERGPHEASGFSLRAWRCGSSIAIPSARATARPGYGGSVC
jgi:hypothetical protein